MAADAPALLVGTLLLAVVTLPFLPLPPLHAAGESVSVWLTRPDQTQLLSPQANPLHRAGMKILASTDANSAPGSPAPIQHGEAVHEELRLLVEAGLTPVEALCSATVESAEYFGFTDRGVIEAGRMADLVLIDGDPT